LCRAAPLCGPAKVSCAGILGIRTASNAVAAAGPGTGTAEALPGRLVRLTLAEFSAVLAVRADEASATYSVKALESIVAVGACLAGLTLSARDTGVRHAMTGTAHCIVPGAALGGSGAQAASAGNSASAGNRGACAARAAVGVILAILLCFGVALAADSVVTTACSAGSAGAVVAVLSAGAMGWLTAVLALVTTAIFVRAVVEAAAEAAVGVERATLAKVGQAGGALTASPFIATGEHGTGIGAIDTVDTKRLGAAGDVARAVVIDEATVAAGRNYGWGRAGTGVAAISGATCADVTRVAAQSFGGAGESYESQQGHPSYHIRDRFHG